MIPFDENPYQAPETESGSFQRQSPSPRRKLLPYGILALALYLAVVAGATLYGAVHIGFGGYAAKTPVPFAHNLFSNGITTTGRQHFFANSYSSASINLLEHVLANDSFKLPGLGGQASAAGVLASQFSRFTCGVWSLALVVLKVDIDSRQLSTRLQPISLAEEILCLASDVVQWPRYCA